MESLREVLARAMRERWATGHFNFSELDQARAIVEACAEARSPAILGTSEGERGHVGLTEAVAIRDALRKDFAIPVFLNADHTKSVAAAKRAIDAGYDSIHSDLSGYPFEENAAGTAQVVAYARAKDPLISLEGEIGYLKGESKVQNEKFAVSPDDYTKPEEAKLFTQRTGIDRLAVVAGNIHGISLDEPDLDIARISAIRACVGPEIALVLHAGSGIPDEQIRAAIGAGIANIHINTDMRVAFMNALRHTLAADPDETAMYKLDASAILAIKAVVKEKLALFGSMNRI
ncbi:MAG: class II fructose-bisphosphate aldolase [Candidatus Sungbacteria bacterium]|uniref:Class II fructose-bisphosphate aldolase n=1 Tax=Candidatus Sungiibacteriota bacterium TaxID=2750080 RepID=A0A932VRM3_9BACT|nr:class II fructose-bisphosphate aldolase [Candidatus Sungbacteria bacterium]